MTFQVLVALMLMLCALVVVPMCLIFPHLGSRWWCSLIPFYNMWVVADKGARSRKLAVVLVSISVLHVVSTIWFVNYPGEGIEAFQFLMSLLLPLFSAIALFLMAKRQGNGVALSLGVAVIPFVFLPVLAYLMGKASR